MDHSKSDNHIQYNPIQPENLDSLPSSQSFQNANPRSASVKPVLNYSIGTGEEFALEFMRDRVNPRMPFVPYPAGDPSRTPGYLELKGIGVSHAGSESVINIVERGSSNHLETIHQTSSEFNGSRGSDSSSKIKILCSFGGKILPHPGDGKLRYVGGNTRIIRIRKDISWQELRQKALEIYIETYAIKYQLPGEDLDALVSVSCDEDLLNMMEECNVLGIGEGSQKLRLFLFSLSDFDETSFNHVSSGGDNEFQFLIAVNGMDMGSRRESSGAHSLMTSSANNLSDLGSQNVERNISPLTFVDPNVFSSNAETSVKQEVKQANVRSPRDDVASPSVLPSEGKLPPKPKMNEDRIQDQIHAKAATPIENDSGTSGNAVGPDNSGSNLIDLSYLETPSRVYHSERIPRGHSEKNRLTKSDDSLGTQLLAAHLQSDVDPIPESVGSLHTEDLQPQITHGRLVNHEKSNDAPTVNNDLVSDTGNVSEASQTLVNEKKVKLDKPSETGSQERVDSLIDINDQFSSSFLSDAFSRAISEDSHGIGVLPQDGVGLSMNITNHEPQHWSYFQKLAQGELQNKDVSLIDQVHLAYLSKFQNAQEVSVGYNVSQFPDEVDSRNAFIEDEEKEIHGSESISLQPHYNPSQVENSEGVQLDDLSENMIMPYSEYETETRNDGLPSIDLALGDLDTSSLQIIRNEDLEELRELGSGTFGTVYHGKWRGTDVAIKRIKKSCFAGRSSEQERLTFEFWREAVILSKLHHPNVMAFYGVVRDGPDGTLATVTEFMVDGSLRHVLVRKDRHLDHRKRLIIAMDTAFGMEYLHSKNIVHFDLKCDNLLVNMKDSSRPICKVGDFGLSKIKRNTLVSGGVRGTLPWMAPELLNGGSNKVSEKVDVFSFGIVMWEILTREEPYANMHYGAIIGGIVNNTLRPTIPSDCDPEWRRLMEQCWAPDPAVRPSFTEITNQLRVMSAAYQNKPHAHKPS
ncbi:RAF-like serine/threonine-protein kinase 20 [Bidens hawaiensis]|uniref:RAF-like serine/threonine-protein kinase 20 n=1 Tax=Bidens hawaiensis TaxID=980011 RepID=UPI004049AB19